MGNGEMKELFRDFDALAVRERVEAFVDLMDKWNALNREGPFRTSRIIYATVEHGIVEAAEALGEELHEYRSESGRFLYYFCHKGYEFNCSSEKRLGKYAGKTIQPLHENEEDKN